MMMRLEEEERIQRVKWGYYEKDETRIVGVTKLQCYMAMDQANG